MMVMMSRMVMMRMVMMVMMVMRMVMVIRMMMVIGPSVEVQERQFQGGQWAVWCQDWLQYTEPLNCCFYRRHLKDFLSADMWQQFNLL